MSTLIKDTFTGTAGTSLAAHTSDDGTTWAPAGFGSNSAMVLSGTGTVQDFQPSSGECAFLTSYVSSSGNVTITGSFIVSAAPAESNSVSVWARVPVGATSYNGYYFSANPDYSNGSVGGFGITSFVNGGGKSLCLSHVPILVDTYNYVWTLNGSAQTTQVQRASDSNFLTTSGTWQTTECLCGSVTDTNFTNGQFGIEFFSASGNNTYAAHGPFTVSDYVPPTPTGTTIPVNDPNLHFSGWNWVLNSSTYAQTNYRGASLKAAFTGTSLGVTLDVSPLTAASATSDQYPWIRYSIDGGPWSDVQLTSATATLALASNLSAGTHTLDLYVLSTNSFLNRWATPANVVRITGLVLDAGATTDARSDLLPNTALFLGDSITEGDGVWGAGSGNTGSPPNNDATAVWCHGLARSLNAEASISGMGGQGWTAGAAGGAPALPAAWNRIDANHPRSFTIPPTYLFINMGTNGGNGGGYTAGVLQAFLTSVRATVGAATKVFVLIPFGGYNEEALTADFNAYQSAATDSGSYLVDLGTVGSAGLTKYGALAPTYQSYDGVHPNVYTHGRLAALGAKAVQSAVAGSTFTAGQLQVAETAVAAAVQTAVANLGSTTPYNVLGSLIR